MAVAHKGWRAITVDAKRFYWRAFGGDWWITAVVVTDAAFVRGRTAQQLRFRLDYDQLRKAHPSGAGISLHQRAAITPSVVRKAIELSRRCEPAFSGDLDLADVELSETDALELQKLARLEPPSLSAGPGLSALGPADRDLIRDCLRAAADGPLFTDKEFSFLFGAERSTLRALVTRWPDVDERDNATHLAIHNSLVHLVDRLHGQEAILSDRFGIDRDRILHVFTLWQEASRGPP